jgi:hypothetical protein
MTTNNCEHHHGDFEKLIEVETPFNEKTSSPVDSILSNMTITQHIPPGKVERINGIVVGRIIHAEKTTAPLVDFPANVSGIAIKALSTVTVGPNDKNRDVALAFVNGDPNIPVIIGFMHAPATSAQPQTGELSKTLKVESDGETVTISAEKQIVLKCGESSITLTKAGKVLLNGTYVSSRSKGVNRMRGGSVLLN